MMSIGDSSRGKHNKDMGKRAGKRPGRKPSKIDERAKLERSRQSARECRARKKLRYQYLEELVLNREKAVFALRDELETYKQWCFSLEHGEQLPESLLKMLASDDISVRASEIEQVKRSKLHSQLSSSTSSVSPDASPVGQPNSQTSRTFEHQNRPMQHSILHNSLQNSLFTHEQNQQQFQEIQQVMETSSTAPLQRQMAFDHSNNYQNCQLSLPQINNPGQTRTQTFASQPASSNQVQSQQQQLLLQNSSGQARTTSSSFLQKTFSLPQSNNLQIATNSWKSEDSTLYKEKKDIPTNYTIGFDELNTFSKTGQRNSQVPQEVSLRRAGEPSRRRSLSNPASMTTHSRSNTQTTNNFHMPSSLQDFITSHDRSRPTIDQQDSFLGLFSGNLIGGTPSSLSSLIPTSITVEDSSSSNETMDDISSDKSMQNSQKRKQIFPASFENPKRSIPVVNKVSVNQLTSNFDLQPKNMNQSNVSYFGLTKTSQTTSQTWGGLTTSGMASSTSNQRYSEVPSLTTSSSNIELPTPLSSLSMLLEQYAVSPGLSSDTFEINTPTTCSHNIPSQVNSAGLNSFNQEHQPEWYSFIDDLHDGTISNQNHHYMTPTSNTPTTMTSNLHGELLVPSSSFMNVPNIIDEILDLNNQL